MRSSLCSCRACTGTRAPGAGQKELSWESLRLTMPRFKPQLQQCVPPRPFAELLCYLPAFPGPRPSTLPMCRAELPPGWAQLFLGSSWRSCSQQASTIALAWHQSSAGRRGGAQMAEGGQAAQGEHRDLVYACGDGARKDRAQLQLGPARDAEGSKKGFAKCVGSQSKAKKPHGPTAQWGAGLVTENMWRDFQQADRTYVTLWVLCGVSFSRGC